MKKKRNKQVEGIPQSCFKTHSLTRRCIAVVMLLMFPLALAYSNPVRVSPVTKTIVENGTGGNFIVLTVETSKNQFDYGLQMIKDYLLPPPLLLTNPLNHTDRYCYGYVRPGSYRYLDGIKYGIAYGLRS